MLPTRASQSRLDLLAAKHSASPILSELWAAVGTRLADTFDGETGLRPLSRHFYAVERRDTDGQVLWEDREALQSYLDAYSEMLGKVQAPEGPFPFRAGRRNCVFVARTPSSRA
jgi:hypothetical protein